MFAILNSADANVGKVQSHTINSALIEELQQAFRHGLRYPLHAVQKQFHRAAAIAQRAQAEQAEDEMVAAALLFQPCQILFTNNFSPKPWNSDSLLESGTYDWLSENFDSVVAETIRMQPHTRRYLASVVGGYYRQLDDERRHQLLEDGGLMSHDTRIAFSRGKYFCNSLRLARWIDQVTQARLDCMDPRYFEQIFEDLMPGISRAAKHI